MQRFHPKFESPCSPCLSKGIRSSSPAIDDWKNRVASKFSELIGEGMETARALAEANLYAGAMPKITNEICQFCHGKGYNLNSEGQELIDFLKRHLPLSPS